MDIMVALDPIHTMETLLRVASLVSVGAGFLYLLYALYRRSVQPRFVWLYTLFVVGLMLIMRVAGLLEDAGIWTGEIADLFLGLRASMNQAVYILLGIDLILLVRSHIVGMRRHEVEFHGD